MEAQQNILHIKNMVCNRCIKVVRDELEKLGVQVESINLGEVVTAQGIEKELKEKVKGVLEENGFELLEDKKSKIIEKIKKYVIEIVHHSDGDSQSNFNYSALIAKELGMDYAYLSNLFSSLEGITIEHFIILQRIERAKELLKYGDLTLSEIAYKLGYSSVQHLSIQFKKITGLTASQFKKMTDNTRKPLDKVNN